MSTNHETFHQCSLTQSSSTSGLKGELLEDPFLKLRPEVQIIRLPNYLINPVLSASSVDQIYSELTNKLISRKSVHHDLTQIHSSPFIDVCNLISPPESTNEVEPSSSPTSNNSIPIRKEDVSKTFSSNNDTMKPEQIDTSQNMIQEAFIIETLEPVVTQMSINHNVTMKRSYSELEFEQMPDQIELFKSKRYFEVPLEGEAESIVPSVEQQSPASSVATFQLDECEFDDGSTFNEDLVVIKKPQSSSSSNSFDLNKPLDLPSSPAKDQNKLLPPSSSSTTDSRNQTKDSQCSSISPGPSLVSIEIVKNKTHEVPKHWLDVSEMSPKSELIVKLLTRSNRKINAESIKMMFNSLYDQFGKHKDEFDIIDRGKSLTLMIRNQQSRMRIQQELKTIFTSNKRFGCELSVILPNSENPNINFEFDSEITAHNAQGWIKLIKQWNHWPQDALAVWKYTQLDQHNMFKICIEIDSSLRELIEQTGGQISIGHRRVNVVDCLGLWFCYNSLAYNKCCRSTCVCPVRCCFCNCWHESRDCWYRGFPDRWFCELCQVKGHSAVSKSCPVLITKIHSRITKFSHKYKYIFLEEYNFRNGNRLNAMARLL